MFKFCSPCLFVYLFTALCGLLPQSAQGIPVYLRPDSLFPSGQFPLELLEKRTTSIHLQPWYRIKTPQGSFGWVPADHVLLATQLKRESIDLAFNKERVVVFQAPYRKSPILRSIRRHQFFEVPFSQDLDGEWLKVKAQVENSTITGYVERHQLITKRQLTNKDLIILTNHLPLRSAPGPESDLLMRLMQYSTAHILETRTLKWGQVKINEAGLAWWPIDQVFSQDPKDMAEKLKTSELFSRKIFDMASSPVITNLKFVSASGIYRSLNGEDWIKIDDFKNQNFPISITKSGVIFVGDSVSSDHGESFEKYIRWERLAAAIKKHWHTTPVGLKILEIQTLDTDGDHLQLRVEVAPQKSVRLDTPDRGQSWHPTEQLQENTSPHRNF